MAFEGIICPACSGTLNDKDFLGKIICPHCNTLLRQKKYLAFLEFLMMQGLVTDIDFFDESMYGHEIQKSETEDELLDETIHDEFEDKSEKMEYVDEKHQLKEESTSEEDFRKWKGLEEDWEDFNKKK
jgi:acetyl/propionyl-CoA carboxylase alpha subunit